MTANGQAGSWLNGAALSCVLALALAAGCRSTSSQGPATTDGPVASAAARPVRGAAAQGPAVAASVENTGADCPVPALAEPAQLPLLQKLPDPFLKLDGTRLVKRSEWRCRRQEILRQAEKYIYGQKPPPPDKVTGSVSAREVSVDVEHGGRRIHFSAEVVLPAQGQGPFPALLNLGTRGGRGGVRLGEELLLGQGVALIFYNQYDLGKEGRPEASRGLPNPGLFYELYGSDHPAGLLMAWAWGASRILDVLQQSGGALLDAARVGVTGCSRNGKGAFTVGVFDERVALTIAHETSTGGVPAYRMVDVLNGAERTNHNFYGLNWLANDFRPFVENATQLPIDSHELVAALAPRGLLVLDNPHIPQFAATAGYIATLAGAEVYRALGAAQNISYVSDVANEKHCATGKPEYEQPLIASIAAFLKRERPAASTFAVSSKGREELARWRDWPTPELVDDIAR